MSEPNEYNFSPMRNSKGVDRLLAARTLFSKTLPTKSTGELQYYAGKSRYKSEEDKKSDPATIVSDFSQDNSDPEARRAPKPKFVPVPLDFWKPTPHAKPVDEGNNEVSATDLVQLSSYESSPKLSHSPTDALLEAGLENMIEATNTNREARDEGVDDEERAARIDESNARLKDEAELRSERAAQEKERQEEEYGRENLYREHKKKKRKGEWKF
jgi:hypothetical protein